MPEDVEITPEILLHAYASGVFPMADSATDTEIYWVDPHRRGIIPLDGFHTSRSLSRRIRRGGYQVKINSAFLQVVQACADRNETWINQQITDLYVQLHEMGHAHSFEVWADNRLVGGVYGVTLGTAFFGESMFSRQTDASKLALYHLVEHLNVHGFTLFDAQFLTDHLASLGAIEIEREHYHKLLQLALEKSAEFT